MAENFSFIDQAVTDLIEPHSKVLDLGCGDGHLLAYLAQVKNAQVQGVEISEEAIYRCVEKGLNVFHGDIESGLAEFPKQSFDYVILNQTLPEVKQVDFVLQEALRVGKKVIISFPNYAYFTVRLHMLFLGKVPVVKSLPNPWYDTPSVRFLSIQDFREFCQSQKVRILKVLYPHRGRLIKFLPNLFSTYAVFVLAPLSNPNH